jgi:hypothetical protein
MGQCKLKVFAAFETSSIHMTSSCPKNENNIPDFFSTRTWIYERQPYMKENARCFFALFFIMSLTAKADVPIFGNSPGDGTGFDVVVYNQLSLSGGAVEFTPRQNINLSSVTLWLSDYTGQYNQTINAGIYYNNCGNSFNNQGTATYFPGALVLGLSSPAPNDGSLAPFTFSDPSGSTVLSANTGYWLVVTASGQPGDYLYDSNWVAGETPTGDAVYDRSDNYNVNNGTFDSSSVLPAFTLNAVPEPGSAALMGLSFLLLGGCALYKRRILRP